MKMKLAVLMLASAVFSQAYAQEVKLPFVHKAVPHEGLVINYDMSGSALQKVACIFENFYKPYVTYTDNGSNMNVGFGGDQEIYFTSIGKTFANSQGLDALDQYHADAKSHITVKDPNNSAIAYATCFYVPEEGR